MTEQNGDSNNSVGGIGGIRAAKPMRFDNKNMNIIYKEWIQQFEWFAIATQLDKKTSPVHAATLMATIGPEAAVVFNTFNLTTAQQQEIGVIKSKFSAYFNPKRNTSNTSKIKSERIARRIYSQHYFDQILSIRVHTKGVQHAQTRKG